MNAVEFAASVIETDNAAGLRLVAALTRYGFGHVRRLWNPTSGRDDGVTPSRTAVVIAEDERGHRLCVKFYDESERGLARLRWHAQCLAALRGVIPVPELLAVDPEPQQFGLPALVMSYLGEPLDHAISALSDPARVKLAEDVTDSLLALSQLDLHACGLQTLTLEELRRKLKQRFAEDSAWYLEHAPADTEARDLVLRGAKILAQTELSVSAATLCHYDLVASNITVRDGLLSGFIDWDYAEVAPPELDLGSIILGFLVSLPIPRPERLRLLQAMLTRYRSQAETMPLLFSLDALLDWTIGGKNAPMDDFIWALSRILKAIESEAPLVAVLR